MRERLLVEPGHSAEFAKRTPDDDLGYDKMRATARRAELVSRLAEYQARLYAEDQRTLLLVLQGLDTSGKDGTIRRVLTGVNPSGCRVVSFKAPTAAELAHDYLHRIHLEIPRRGMIGVFNRSHYEDIVTASVLGVITGAQRKRRCRQVRDFERMLHDEGIIMVKVFLHLSPEEQRRRLQSRVQDPTKGWKFEANDLKTRARFDEYMHRYEDAIGRTSTSWAPWYVVPADHKWASALAVAELLVGRLTAMDPQFPEPAVGLGDVRID